ncbi:apolipoprotein N-acyltransferase [Rhodococcus sp. BP-252]|uniref:apolipoprotein N-acyltransferase n=1 Tax=unclassified Rhodococcus (in: high G+C Gram-positive bacteria) TaxID=192944 RepID=UPI001C9B1E6E|nr:MULTISPECIES: apolipoprotein N-acyltransferase [unclassified Rhodococcus (in: high G+C Gram-positive bacteria)]MBY6410101.1 apolipoprotein N-acyltransferase [Rhodococcus sp. BP-320]MBY6415070.1 apolipoprotein N-acyltransferase [Rhodococcus sp. BP-321]MBY6421227.1 apolipoprotein N-acyltransferase [Rhodococcus sp. BP-324]MBY6425622.1 apolipoprotein N-acyltransferase [Rhodococcus sp. BP-323]MBY6429966.1 apolipoprotein N-acyltransferase [Rhodococcus sp. BP-322]
MKRDPRAITRVAASSAVSVASGLLLYLSFPPRTLWFLAPLSIALLVLVLVRGRGDGPQSKKAGFGYGLLAGLGFFVPLLPWIGVYVGPLPWLALATAESVFTGLFGVLAVVAARTRWWPLALALVWSLVEWARSSFPFGGFPWGRLAFGQPDGWLLPLAGVGGAPLLSFGVALTGTGLAAVAVALLEKRLRGIIVGVSVAASASIVALAVAPMLIGDSHDPDSRTITVAAIQGSVPRLGLDFNAQRRAVLDNHVRETLSLADDVRAGRTPAPDLVVWPENASDIDPLRNADAATEITAASEAVGAPILVGSVLVNDDRTTTNSVIVWDGAAGPGERHDKKIIQPFGEYLPWRSFFRLFSEYADRAGYFVPGTGNGVVHADGITAGIATCYEVAFDRALNESVRSGAEFIAIPTNNATFGDTEMTYQQLAMSRVRAVEHGRSVVVAATSGVSAIVSPSGAVTQRTELFVPDALVSQIELRHDTTVATDLGAIPEYVLCSLAAIFVVVGVARSRRTIHTTGSVGKIDH